MLSIFKKELISIAQLAKQTSIQKQAIEDYLLEKNLIEKKGKWTIPTHIGKKQGIEERYNAKTKMKYVLFPQDFKIDMQNTIQKQQEKEKNKTSYQEKIKKGEEYEAFIAKFFKEQGWVVWEHGKEKGKKDSSIDLVIKKNKHIYFVQCKNWESWKINHKEVKATRTDIRDYLEKNQFLRDIIKNYKMKILYVTSKECLTKGAYKYIEENQDILEYKVIPMKDDFEDF